MAPVRAAAPRRLYPPRRRGVAKRPQCVRAIQRGATNNLEEVGTGTVHDSRSVYTEYEHRQREWNTRVLPALRRPKLTELVEACRAFLSRRDLRAGRSRPHPKNQQKLESILQKLGYL